jgi:hypothetical protein
VLVILRLLFIVSLMRFDVRQLSPSTALLASVASDILLLIITRQSLRWLLFRTTLLRMTITFIIHLLIIFLVFVLPSLALLARGIDLFKGAFGAGVAMFALFNIPTAIAASSFVLLLLIVLLHRVTWPLFSRLAYVLTRNNVLNKRNALRYFAWLLIIYGLAEPKLGFILKAVENLHK